MTNVFKDEKTLGDELVRFHRQHTGQPIERFFKFILPKHLLGFVKEAKTTAVKLVFKAEAERVEAEKKKEKKK